MMKKNREYHERRRLKRAEGEGEEGERKMIINIGNDSEREARSDSACPQKK